METFTKHVTNKKPLSMTISLQSDIGSKYHTVFLVSKPDILFFENWTAVSFTINDIAQGELAQYLISNPSGYFKQKSPVDWLLQLSKANFEITRVNDTLELLKIKIDGLVVNMLLAPKNYLSLPLTSLEKQKDNKSFVKLLNLGLLGRISSIVMYSLSSQQIFTSYAPVNRDVVMLQTDDYTNINISLDNQSLLIDAKDIKDIKISRLADSDTSLDDSVTPIYLVDIKTATNAFDINILGI